MSKPVPSQITDTSAEVTNPDLVAVATRVPEAIICLVSALTFHEITTEVSQKVYIALPPGVNKPRIDHPPLPQDANGLMR